MYLYLLLILVKHLWSNLVLHPIRIFFFKPRSHNHVFVDVLLQRRQSLKLVSFRELWSIVCF